MKADFMPEWEREYGGKEFFLGDPQEKEKFLVAASELLRFLAHTARTATVCTVKQPDREAISTVFIRIT